MSHKTPVSRGHPGNMSGGPKFPGPPGFHIPTEPIEDPNMLQRRPKQKTQVEHLNQYTGYFSTPEGDFPVSVVANSIAEASKILTMPGVFGEDTDEPTTIKFVKGKIAVSAPVRMTGFQVHIDPPGAAESGAYAVPAQADVRNGTSVIFTAHEPFGWKFVGWFKGEQLLSTQKVTTIEVYDPFTSLIFYTARFEFDPTLRNGRYLELGRGWYFDFKFDGWASFAGKVVLYSKQLFPDWHFTIESITDNDGEVDIVLETDKTIIQGTGEGVPPVMTLTLTPTAIGFNAYVKAITINNPFGLVTNETMSLRWVGFHGSHQPWEKEDHRRP